MIREKTTRTVAANPALDRRTVLKATGAAAAFTIGAPMIWQKASAQDRRIVIRDPGGPYEQGFGEAFYKPFTEATGIEAVGVAGQHEPTSQIKAMVDTGSYTWDMALLSRSAHNQLITEGEGYLEELGLDTPGIQEVPERFRTPYYVGNNVFTAILAYRTDAFEGREPPQNWQDLWDVERVPGRRALRKHPFDTMEEALLADGVPPEELYPLDLDRAFASLDKISNEVAIWWEGGAQTSQMLKTGEVDICPTWNARAQAAIDDGAPVKIVWHNNIYSSEGWCIIKGTPKADLCREFIRFAADAERQAAFTPHLGYGPTIPRAYEFIDPERAKILPTYEENFKTAVAVDEEYWGEHKDQVIERFNAWLLG
jgi:putative spermidine/putrescine transport system substrate-binding protein